MTTNRGRPAKPTALKVLTGNPGKRPLNESEPKPAPASLECPEHLDEPGRAFWERYAPTLKGFGLLTELDVPAFTTACEQHSLYVRLYARIAKAPFGKVAERATRRMNQAEAIRNRILSQFGFSPSARAKLHTGGGEEEDPFETFMSKRGKA